MQLLSSCPGCPQQKEAQWIEELLSNYWGDKNFLDGLRSYRGGMSFLDRSTRYRGGVEIAFKKNA